MPLTKVIWKECIDRAQLRIKVPIGYNGMPQNCPFPFDDNHPHLIHPSFDRTHSPPKRHPDSLSRFATVHFLERQTDWQMV